MISRTLGQIQEYQKIIGDFVSGGAVVTYLAGWGSLILAVPGSIYACLRIYEWFEKRRKQ